jgi:hypothetical protein
MARLALSHPQLDAFDGVVQFLQLAFPETQPVTAP